MAGPKVTIASSGIPVVPVETGGAPFSLAESGGIAIVLATSGIPVTIEGYSPTPTPTPTPAPSWSVQPSISGTPQVGQTLSGSDGTISNGTVSARAWLRNGSAISGANGANYLLDSADEAADISFQVTATGAGGSSQATSTSVGPITQAPMPRRNTYLLVIGQSNGIAAGTTAANMAADGTSTPSDITAITTTGKVKQQYWNGSAFAVANYVPATGNPGSGGFSSTVAAWGPEAGFASAWLAEQTHPDSLLLIQKVVVDSSNLGQFVNPSTGWSWIGAGTGFIANMKTWATANSVVFDDFIVILANCESEGTNSTLAAQCETRLTSLIASLRATGQLGVNAKVCLPELPNNPASYSQLATVRAAQVAVAGLDAKNFLIETDDLLPYRDAFHFKAPAMATIGARAYSAIK